MTIRLRRHPLLARWAASAALVLALVGASTSGGGATATGGSHDAPIVKTDNGPVRGAARQSGLSRGGYRLLRARCRHCRARSNRSDRWSRLG